MLAILVVYFALGYYNNTKTTDKVGMDAVPHIDTMRNVLEKVHILTLSLALIFVPKKISLFSLSSVLQTHTSNSLGASIGGRCMGTIGTLVRHVYGGVHGSP